MENQRIFAENQYIFIENLFQYILKDEWKAFEAGNAILRAIRKQYGKDTDREVQLYQVQKEVWEKMTKQYPWIVQFEEVDCTVNPPDLGWGLFCYLEEMTSIAKKYHLAELDEETEKVIETMVDHLLMSGTVAAVAKEMGIDRQELNRSMKKRTGISANEFCHMLKIEYAARVLTDSREEIPAIAGQLGYPSEEIFRKKFKEVIGCKPEQYRKKGCA